MVEYKLDKKIEETEDNKKLSRKEVYKRVIDLASKVPAQAFSIMRKHY